MGLIPVSHYCNYKNVVLQRRAARKLRATFLVGRRRAFRRFAMADESTDASSWEVRGRCDTFGDRDNWPAPLVHSALQLDGLVAHNGCRVVRPPTEG